MKADAAIRVHRRRRRRVRRHGANVALPEVPYRLQCLRRHIGQRASVVQSARSVEASAEEVDEAQQKLNAARAAVTEAENVLATAGTNLANNQASLATRTNTVRLLLNNLNQFDYLLVSDSAELRAVLALKADGSLKPQIRLRALDSISHTLKLQLQAEAFNLGNGERLEI